MKNREKRVKRGMKKKRGKEKRGIEEERWNG